MKACIIQPDYKFSMEYADECFEGLISQLDKCDESMDVIVCPEYCDTPVVVKTLADFEECIKRYNERIITKAKETAIRCNAAVFVNAAYKTENGYRNTTHAFNGKGELVGRYFKAHPAPSEFKKVNDGGRGMDCDYSYQYNEPYTIDIDGVRYGFMTCYDFYFYESFAALARKNVDVIIGASHQRSDTHEALRIINRFLCYNTNAYLLRSSVSLGADSPLGGCSMIVSPRGEILVDMVNDVGIASCEFNPRDKYYKPAGFGGKMKSHWEYIEEGRHPQSYRAGGSSVVPSCRDMKYPRVCIKHGADAENKNIMADFGAAVALGANEIFLDISALESLKLSVIGGDAFSFNGGTLNYTLEDVLKKLSCRAIFNIHVRTNPKTDDYRKIALEIEQLLLKYDAEHHAYITSENDDFLKAFAGEVSQIACCLSEGKDTSLLLTRANALGLNKIQIPSSLLDDSLIADAHKNGIYLNVIAEDAIDAEKCLARGVDTVITNNCEIVLASIK